MDIARAPVGAGVTGTTTVDVRLVAGSDAVVAGSAHVDIAACRLAVGSGGAALTVTTGRAGPPTIDTGLIAIGQPVVAGRLLAAEHTVHGHAGLSSAIGVDGA